MLRVNIKGNVGSFQLMADFQAAPGVTALFGPSGAGKSTILRAIAGLWQPQEGTIALGETMLFDSVSGTHVPTEHRKLGVVFQDPLLFPHMSVAKNLRYGAGKEASNFDRITKLLDLNALLNRMPRNLSGGEAQRVAIGRALLVHPKILLLDEPMTGIDETRRDQILPFLEKIKNETRIPVLYVSHNADEILRLADAVIMVKNGKTDERLTPEAFETIVNPGLPETTWQNNKE